MNTIIIIEKKSNCLRPFFGRPFLEHVIESLIERYINEIHIFCYENPDKIMAVAGNGEKWGSTFHHHHINNQDLSNIIVNSINTKNMTMVVNPDYIVKPNYKYVKFQKGFNTLFFKESSYTGWGLFPPNFFGQFNFKNPDQLNNKLSSMNNISEVVTNLLSVASYEEWLVSSNKVLSKNDSGIIIKCREPEEGVFNGRNTSIGKNTIIKAPVYIGENTVIGEGGVIGPFATIGKNCRLDDQTIIKNSLIDNNSYIGRAMNIEDSVVYGNRIFNTELSSEIAISDKFLVSNLLQDFL